MGNNFVMFYCYLQGERISSVSEKIRAKLDVPPKEFDKVSWADMYEHTLGS